MIPLFNKIKVNQNYIKYHWFSNKSNFYDFREGFFCDSIKIGSSSCIWKHLDILNWVDGKNILWAKFLMMSMEVLAQLVDCIIIYFISIFLICFRLNLIIKNRINFLIFIWCDLDEIFLRTKSGGWKTQKMYVHYL